jgi:predicted regulator of Ras-like GTPase activity (Roadblock/LC7/MglB family)
VKPKNYRRKASTSIKVSKTGLATPDPLANQVVQQVLAELPGLLAVAVVDVASGMSLAAHSTATINPDTAATYNAEVVKQKQKAMAALLLTDERIDDILITLSSQLHLLQLTPDGRRFIYLVVSAQNTNLGIARQVLRAQVGQLQVQ